LRDFNGARLPRAADRRRLADPSLGNARAAEVLLLQKFLLDLLVLDFKRVHEDVLS